MTCAAPTGDADSATDGGTATAEWDELVGAALLGRERRALPGGSGPALLVLAAVRTVRGRAGLTPAAATGAPEPAGADPRPPLPRAAALRLTHLVRYALRSTAARGWNTTGGDLAALAPEWLEIANEQGYRPPPWQIPELLDAARHRTDLRAAVLTFAGPRGLWLAALRPEWRFALRAAPAGTATAASGSGQPGSKGSDGSDGPDGADRAERQRRLWEEGLFAERVGALTALRAADPEAGRELLVSTWSQERAEDRLMFLDALREELYPGDEPFLEAALTDRGRTVRATAAELLSVLPGSALAGRMAVRAGACVALDRTGAYSTDTLVVEPPPECDAAMTRDGVVAKPPQGRGERSWWLTQVVEAASLGRWSAHLGGRTPEEIVALPVADDWRDDLHAAWSRAAVHQRDAAWARALLGPPDAPVAEAADRAATLLSLMPPADRTAWATGFISAKGLTDAYRVLADCPTPWPPPLAKAVMGGFHAALRRGASHPNHYSGVLGLAQQHLDPAVGRALLSVLIPEADRAVEVEAEAAEKARREAAAAAGDASQPAPRRGGGPTRGEQWAAAFRQLADTLELREVMRAELETRPAR
ncbi:DUF5691 domain-containing protein [Streptomyces otsuchiensis]|uniref:DUF5691 domain-containing protein n=1 Tax=Streptomyces otsuchiensis TaxID=2681388 RepID=UPI001D13177D|nr:DUF5691 domain-containing protein [Streptomyces otsuchiensis]